MDQVVLPTDSSRCSFIPRGAAVRMHQDVAPNGDERRKPPRGDALASEETTTEVALEAPTALIVDDDRDIREALNIVLGDEGFRCIMAENGAEALELLRTQGRQPDLILLDLMMPFMNGWEFRAVQLAEPELARIPVVVLTAATDPAMREDFGTVHTLRKPVDLDALMDCIEYLVPGWPPAE